MPDSLKIALKNDSDHPNLHVYVTGIAIQHGGKRFILNKNCHDLYFPQNPPKIGTRLAEECAIPLGNPGNTVYVTIPQIAGGRIWISEGKLTFLLNPGPALVEPSVLNPSDPNASVNFGFCELTLNHDQLFANISYVDFVPRIPIALTLTEASGHTQHVTGLCKDGLDGIARDLVQQANKDHHPWDKLIVKYAGRNLRILNATHGGAVGASFDNYYDEHIERVWQKYSKVSRMKIDTQTSHGVLEGHVNRHGQLVVGPEFFDKPTSSDILGCNSGPFTTGPSAVRNAIIPRLAAAFVRSSLLDSPDQPSHPKTYYKTFQTNHYARIVHEHNIDGKGYSFAYDDVIPQGADDQSGKVNSAQPTLLTVTFGGKSAGAGGPKHQMLADSTDASAQAFENENPPLVSSQRPEEGGWKGVLKGIGDRLIH